MRAVRYHGQGDIRVEQIDEPVCGKGDVKIRPAFAGICGSDLHEYLAGPLTIPGASTPHAVTGATVPVTLGHEFSGTVEEVGEGVGRVKAGDRVTVKPNLYDGNCPSCLMGRVNCCRNLGFIGYSSDAGGMADLVVVKEKHAILLPDWIPLDIGALVEPLTIAWHAVKRSRIENTQTALVIGGGPIGLAIMLALRAHGIATIIVAEVSQQRRAYARALGATDVLDPAAEDVVGRVRAMTGDAGADMAFECSGVQAGLDAAVGGIRTRGTVTIVSLWETKPAIDAFEVVSSEKHVLGAVVCEEGDFEAVIEAIRQGRLDPRAMITSKIAMEDVEEKGFRALIGERDRHVKILVDIAA